MRKCESDFPIPDELYGEDVYDLLYLFDDEKEAIDYVVNTCGFDRQKVVEELYEDEMLRKEHGRKHYLRCFQISLDKYVHELMSGRYILYQVY